MSPKKNDSKGPEEVKVVKEEKNDGQVVYQKRDTRFYLGSILILIGALFIVENLYPNLNVWRNFWPVILIIFGFSLIAKGAGE